MPETSYAVSALDELRGLRDAIGQALVDAGVPPDRHHDVALLATELATNAIVHAGPPAQVRLALTDHDVRVGVADASAAPPDVQSLDAHRVGGNGLRIVQAFADEWGVAPAPDGGKEIWFRLAW